MSKKLPEDRCDRCRHQCDGDGSHSWCSMDARAVDGKSMKVPGFMQILDYESLAHFRNENPEWRCPYFKPTTWWTRLRPVAVALFFLGMVAVIAAAAYCLVTA